jgi:glutathione reductase (NADPH)
MPTCAAPRRAAVFAYDERLRLLPSYLQQLEMESNGKSVRLDGSPVGRATSPIVWGGTGTDAQHAVFQLLHQGTHLVPVEFVAAIEPGDTLDEEHHRQLLINCFAQGAALMAAAPSDDPHRFYPGDRPSTTILLDRLDPATLGALIAFYEHRTFANAVLLGINPFDQFGVELGKEMAKAARRRRRSRLRSLDRGPDRPRIRRRRPMTASYDYDLFVIGAGSGGVRAARVSSAHGARVAIAEEYKVGGTCVIRGCVPKKLLVYGAHFAEDLQDAARFGWKIKGCSFDWPTLRDNVLAEVERLEGIYTETSSPRGRDLCGAGDGDGAAPGHARRRREGDRSHHPDRHRRPAVVPNVPGAEHGITSNEMFHLEKMPKRAVIAGGGYIANEFAGIFHEFACQVTIVNRGDVILRHYDEQVRDRLLQISLMKGIDFKFNVAVREGREAQGREPAHPHEGLRARSTRTFCSGRSAATPTRRGSGSRRPASSSARTARSWSTTTIKLGASIYAIGDVTNRIQLTPVAIREGQAFADTIFGKKPTRVDYANVPLGRVQPPAARRRSG